MDTPLHKACWNKNINKVRNLIENEAGVNAKDFSGWTPLHCACVCGHTEIVSLLLENGADPNAKNSINSTPLQIASENGLIHIARVLIEKGADPNAKDSDDSTSLHFACVYGHTHVVRFLLENGANLNAKDSYGRTSLDLAKANGHTDLVHLLSEYKRDLNSAEMKKQIDKLEKELEDVKNLISNRSSSSPSFSIGSVEANDLAQHPPAEFESNDNNGSHLDSFMANKMAIIPCGHVVSHDPNIKFCSACGAQVQSTLNLRN